jgi:hypothetical protein
MNPGYIQVLRASPADRRDLFLGAARRLGTPEQNIEKDFWVCWTLDALFNGLPGGSPRLLFKGGTSLSKGYGLISRFSEDIDITVFRDDLGESASLEELEALSGKKRRAKLDAIKCACREYIQGSLLLQLRELAESVMSQSGIGTGLTRLVIDEDDPDGQSLLFWYPSVSAEPDPYVRPAIKIESGAKSALDPNRALTITPYTADEVPAIPLAVEGVTTVVAERSFWDKVIILHGTRQWFKARGVLRQQGQRVSRHYYDVHGMMQSPVVQRALANDDLARDCARHARMFFGSPDLRLDLAYRGTFTLTPTGSMLEDLAADYNRMGGMIIGQIPRFEDVMEFIRALEANINGPR